MLEMGTFQFPPPRTKLLVHSLLCFCGNCMKIIITHVDLVLILWHSLLLLLLLLLGRQINLLLWSLVDLRLTIHFILNKKSLLCLQGRGGPGFTSANGWFSLLKFTLLVHFFVLPVIQCFHSTKVVLKSPKINITKNLLMLIKRYPRPQSLGIPLTIIQ